MENVLSKCFEEIVSDAIELKNARKRKQERVAPLLIALPGGSGRGRPADRAGKCGRLETLAMRVHYDFRD